MIKLVVLTQFQKFKSSCNTHFLYSLYHGFEDGVCVTKCSDLGNSWIPLDWMVRWICQLNFNFFLSLGLIKTTQTTWALEICIGNQFAFISTPVMQNLLLFLLTITSESHHGLHKRMVSDTSNRIPWEFCEISVDTIYCLRPNFSFPSRARSGLFWTLGHLK